MKSFEYSGVWWLPYRPEHKVPGTVKFAEEDRIILALNGLLETVQVHNFPELLFKRHPLILGLTSDGLAITLIDCFDTNFTGSLEGDGEQRCLAHVTYIGAHFTDLEELRFHKMDVYYSHLSQWAGIFPFRGHQKPFNEISASTTKGKITVHSTRPSGTAWIPEAELPESVCITIESKGAMSLEEWNTQFIFPLQNLLSLATQRPNFLVSLRTYTEQKEVARQDTDALEFPIEIVYPPTFIPFALSKTVFPQTILFTLLDIAYDFSNILDAWLRVADELDSVCSLFFGVQYTNLYLDQRFLFIAQAAEVYQDRRTDKLYLPDNEFHDLIQKILAGCPETHRDWLEDKIQYSNKPTFRRHLKDLVASTSSILQPLIGKNRQARDSFVEVVYDTRNYLTHHTKELKLKAAQGDKLFLITQCLSIVVQACLLKELGFTDELCIQMLRKHEVYQYLLGLQPYAS